LTSFLNLIVFQFIGDGDYEAGGMVALLNYRVRSLYPSCCLDQTDFVLTVRRMGSHVGPSLLPVIILTSPSSSISHLLEAWPEGTKTLITPVLYCGCVVYTKHFVYWCILKQEEAFCIRVDRIERRLTSDQLLDN
jgi:hypothetical protein